LDYSDHPKTLLHPVNRLLGDTNPKNRIALSVPNISPLKLPKRVSLTDIPTINAAG